MNDMVRVAGLRSAVRATVVMFPGISAAAEDAHVPTEVVGPGTVLGMAFFILVAVLIAVSMACKLLLVFGLVPRRGKTRMQKAIVWLANVVGEIRTVPGNGGRRGRASGRGGGGSSGGAGASGKF